MTTTVSRAVHRNRQFWLDHIAQWKTSGLSKAKYCERHELKVGSFYNWSRASVLDSTPISGSDQTSALKFLPVTLTPTPASDAAVSTVVRVVFRNRIDDKLKLLYWQHNGYVLIYKRLEKGCFVWPTALEATMSLSVRELHAFIEGGDLTQLQPV